MSGRVDGFPVHASIVGSEIIEPDIGADTDHGVDGKAVHLTCYRDHRAWHRRRYRLARRRRSSHKQQMSGRVDGFPVHASIVGSEIIEPDIGADTDHRVDG